MIPVTIQADVIVTPDLPADLDALYSLLQERAEPGLLIEKNEQSGTVRARRETSASL